MMQGTLHLPVLPEIAGRVISLANDPNADLQDLCELIEQDQVLAATVLRFSNSAAYSCGETIDSLHQAILRLGMMIVSGIAIAACIDGEAFRSPQYDDLRRRYLTHALVTGGFSRVLARLSRREVESMFLCGLLHSVGKPVVLRAIGDLQSGAAVLINEPQADTLVEEFHNAAAAIATASWNLPRPVQIVATHYRDPEGTDECRFEAGLVRLAARLATWVIENEPPDDRSLHEFPEWETLSLDPDEIDELIEHGRTMRQSATLSLV